MGAGGMRRVGISLQQHSEHNMHNSELEKEKRGIYNPAHATKMMNNVIPDEVAHGYILYIHNIIQIRYSSPPSGTRAGAGGG
jgi:hypothetical protein